MRGLAGGVLAVVVLGGCLGAAGGYMAWRYYSANLPSVDGLKSYQPPVMSRIFASNGQLVDELATERRIFVPFGAIPKMVSEAFVAIEDHNYWSNPGIDPLAIVRAGVFDLTHMGSGRRPIGASTITQQVARNMLLDSDAVSLSRKVREAMLAMRIDQTLSKQRVLELYLNEIYLGQRAFGVAAAAQTYFNKGLDQITLPEAALLAALPKAPNNYNPFKHPDAAKARRDLVLDRMADAGDITRAQAAAAKAQPLVPARFSGPAPVPGAAWFTDAVHRALIQQFGQDETTEGGLMVRISMDPRLQEAAEKTLHNGLMAYDRRMGGWRGPVTHLAPPGADWATPLSQVAVPAGMLPDWRLAIVLSVSDTAARVGWVDDAGQPGAQPHTGTLPLSDVAWARLAKDGKLGAVPHRMAEVVQAGDVIMVQPSVAASQPAPVRVALRQIPVVQGALVSLDPTTGRVLAMVGGWSYQQSQFNRATQAERQPGSSFKPFVYLTALEKGISPSQRFLDAPIVVDTPEGQWRPGNYEGNFGGPTTLQTALEQSLNLVTLRVAQHIGMPSIADTAIAFHEVNDMPRVLPAALGAVDTTVLQEAGAYASIDEGGRLVMPTLIDSVQDQDGHVVWRPNGEDCEDCGDGKQPPLVTDTRTQIADPQSDFQLITMMEGVVQRGTGMPVAKDFNRPIAGKTGTSQDFRDAWFAGFTPDLVTVVWVGFDNPASLGDNQTGAAVAGPIWHDFMAVALKNRPVLNFPQPPGVVMAQWQDGDGTVTDAFKPGQVPGASGSSDVGIASEAVPGATPASAPAVSGNDMDTKLGGLY
jgi:penicillin-binding protein 1A